mmetsp:Transcript_24875/g.56735  ORF Transcript_24875/g.56735 Transcript_24875/m.56735 type:complete len:373 (-) Transcript_24875:81-1199(-)
MNMNQQRNNGIGVSKKLGHCSRIDMTHYHVLKKMACATVLAGSLLFSAKFALSVTEPQLVSSSTMASKNMSSPSQTSIINEHHINASQSSIIDEHNINAAQTWVLAGDSTMRRLTAALLRASNGTNLDKLTAKWFAEDGKKEPRGRDYTCLDKFCYGQVLYDVDDVDVTTTTANTTYVIAPSWYIAGCFRNDELLYRRRYLNSGQVEDPSNPANEPYGKGIPHACKKNMAWLQRFTNETITIKNWLYHTYVAMYLRACESKKRVVITTPVLAGTGTVNYNLVNPHILEWAADDGFRENLSRKVKNCSLVDFFDQASAMRQSPRESTRDPLYGTDNGHGIHIETKEGMFRRLQNFENLIPNITGWYHSSPIHT